MISTNLQDFVTIINDLARIDVHISMMMVNQVRIYLLTNVIVVKEKTKKTVIKK